MIVMKNVGLSKRCYGKLYLMVLFTYEANTYIMSRSLFYFDTSDDLKPIRVN